MVESRRVGINRRVTGSSPVSGAIFSWGFSFPYANKPCYKPLMTFPYQQLLEATIQHLEGIKARGARFVSVTPELLTQLAVNRSAPLRHATTPIAAPASAAQVPNPPKPQQASVLDAKRATPIIAKADEKPV